MRGLDEHERTLLLECGTEKEITHAPEPAAGERYAAGLRLVAQGRVQLEWIRRWHDPMDDGEQYGCYTDYLLPRRTALGDLALRICTPRVTA